MISLRKFKWFLWYFGNFKVPMIGYSKPKLLHVNDAEIFIKIPLRRKTKNHLNSMYFGTLAVGADIAGGLHGFYHAQQANVPVSLAFKSFKANFLKRPESDVYFICKEGERVRTMIEESKQSQKRVNAMIPLKAYTESKSNEASEDILGDGRSWEAVATFELELSLKVLKND